jgi:GAF domain-containing protein
MPAVSSENLHGPLEQTERLYREAAAPLPPVTAEMLAQRAGHFAAGVRLGLDAPQAMRRLHQLTGSLRDVSSLRILLPEILDTSVSLTRADFGNLQLLDPLTGMLRIVTQSGFDRRFLDHFAVVDDARSSCGRAARERAQIVIADVDTDPDYAPHRDMAAAAGYRAVQSTPMVDYAGHLMGVVSTHFRRPHRPPEMNLRVMELYADVAGEAVAGHLGVPGDDRRGDPIGRAVISALLDPGDGQLTTVIAFPGPRPSRDSRQRGPVQEAADPEETVLQFTGHVVNQLFSVGLSLESARSITGRGPAGDRIAQATDKIDDLITDIRTAMFSRATDPPAPVLKRMAQTARLVQIRVLDAAVLLEQQADLAGPGRIEYLTEVQRWRDFANQAGQIAERWEQGP